MVFFCVRTDSHSLCHDGQTGHFEGEVCKGDGVKKVTPHDQNRLCGRAGNSFRKGTTLSSKKQGETVCLSFPILYIITLCDQLLPLAKQGGF